MSPETVATAIVIGVAAAVALAAASAASSSSWSMSGQGITSWGYQPNENKISSNNAGQLAPA